MACGPTGFSRLLTWARPPGTDGHRGCRTLSRDWERPRPSPRFSHSSHVWTWAPRWVYFPKVTTLGASSLPSRLRWASATLWGPPPPQACTRSETVIEGRAHPEGAPSPDPAGALGPCNSSLLPPPCPPVPASDSGNFLIPACLLRGRAAGAPGAPWLPQLHPRQRLPTQSSFKTRLTFPKRNEKEHAPQTAGRERLLRALLRAGTAHRGETEGRVHTVTAWPRGRCKNQINPRSRERSGEEEDVSCSPSQGHQGPELRAGNCPGADGSGAGA